MKAKDLTKYAAVVGCACLVGVQAYAIMINDPGVVGTVDSLAGDTGPDEQYFAQNLLDLAANVVDLPLAGPGSIPVHIYNTSSTDYSGTIIGPGSQSGQGEFSVPAGWDYALAKYDGKHAGYVLWYLGGVATVLPQYPAPLWTTNPTKYAISHYTVFNDHRNVPDGGATVLLLGAALSGLGAIARRIKE